jgi:hypothetical protein
VFRCGAHLSNLALGSSRKAQSSVGSNLIQVASRFGVFRVFFSWPDVVLGLTGRVRSVQNRDCVSALTTGRGPCEDRTRWSDWHVSLEENHPFGRALGVIGTSGHVPVRSCDDWMRPVITNRTRSRVRSRYSKLPARSDASDHPWPAHLVTQPKFQNFDRYEQPARPATSSGASGHSAEISEFRPLRATGVSGHFDRRVRSPRVLLSWQVTVRFDCGVYKYILTISFRGLLLICSAEKHHWSARECKSPSEDRDLRIKVWESSLVTRV